MSKLIEFPKTVPAVPLHPLTPTMVVIETESGEQVLVDVDVLYAAMNKTIPVTALSVEAQSLAVTMPVSYTHLTLPTTILV